MIAIVDYGIKKDDLLIKQISKVNLDFKITSSELEILHADSVILPDTNNISAAVKRLHLLNLFTMLRVCSKPMLGISRGMHLMSAFTKEGNLACLGIFPGTVEKFDEEKKKSESSASREIILVKESGLFKNLHGDEGFYFNSPYYLQVNQNTSAVSGHAPIFSAAVEKNQFYGVQFLPEESGDAGLQMLKNFAGL